MLVPRRDGYEARARKGKMLRDFVGKKSTLADLGELPSATPRGRPQGNVSYEGHTNMPWRMEATRQAAEKLNQAKEPTQLGPGSGDMGNDEISPSEAPRHAKQMDSLSQPPTSTASANNLEKGQRKRMTLGITGVSEHEGSMSAFRNNVKKRKTLGGTKVQQSSLLSEGPISMAPAAGSSSISQSTHASGAKAVGSSQKLHTDDKSAPTDPTTSLGSVAAGVGKVNLGDESSNSSNPSGNSGWEC